MEWFLEARSGAEGQSHVGRHYQSAVSNEKAAHHETAHTLSAWIDGGQAILVPVIAEQSLRVMLAELHP
jgi:hypothetical protein